MGHIRITTHQKPSNDKAFIIHENIGFFYKYNGSAGGRCCEAWG